MEATELCAKFITRQIQELNPDDLDEILYVLDNRGHDVPIDTNPRQICSLLMEDIMKQEGVRGAPITGYAHKVIAEIEAKRIERDLRRIQAEKAAERKRKLDDLKSKQRILPGCTPDRSNIIKPPAVYSIILDPDLGMNSDGSYSSFVLVPSELYSNIFMNVNNPVLEIRHVSNRMDKNIYSYARISGSHDFGDNYLVINPLVNNLLGGGDINKVTVKLCRNMPEIANITFTYYGNKEELGENLESLVERLPNIITNMNFLNLGMEINVNDNVVRVDELISINGENIYSGIFPLGESDIPFEIESEN